MKMLMLDHASMGSKWLCSVKCLYPDFKEISQIVYSQNYTYVCVFNVYWLMCEYGYTCSHYGFKVLRSVCLYVYLSTRISNKCLAHTVLYTDVDVQCDKLWPTTVTSLPRWPSTYVDSTWDDLPFQRYGWWPPKFKWFTWLNHAPFMDSSPSMG